MRRREERRVALVHAYSRRNAGDGLLVDLSVRMIREALGASTHITLVASEPASFSASLAGGYNAVVPAPVIARTGWRRGLACAAALASIPTAETDRCARMLQRADLIVGVGGGYLRARTNVEALKLQAGHLMQLRAVVESGVPAVYLSQSIGPVQAWQPMATRLSAVLKRQLGDLRHVYLRDGRSLQWLGHPPNASRAPDLALLELGNRLLAPRIREKYRPVRHVALVLREAPAWAAERRERYRQQMLRLIAMLRQACRVSFAVQSAVRGNDDAKYYRSLGIEPSGSLRSLLRGDRPDAVVSVRLHGALESILAGLPAYHLSYERKGFGAYEDLGLGDWVQNSADFDPEQVVNTVMASDAEGRFQASIQLQATRLREHWQSIVETLRVAGDGRADVS